MSYLPSANARRLLALGKPPLPWVGASLLSMVAVAFLGALPPLFTGRIVDALQSADARAAFVQLGLYAAVTIASSLASCGNSYAVALVRESVARALRVASMEKLLRARLDGIERLTLGQIANRVNADVNELCARFEYSFFPCVQGLCSFLATAATMFALDYRFALVSLAAVAISILPTKLSSERFTDLIRRNAEVQDELAGALNESATISALALLRAPRARARELASYAGIADRARGLHLANALLNSIVTLGLSLANLAGPVAVLGTGTYLLLHHAATVGTIVTFLIYQARLYGPFGAVSMLPLHLSALDVTAGRILEIAGLEDERGGDEPFRPGEIRMRGVRVQREGREILSGARLAIARGARAAIVGPSGSGKSTLALLLLRLHDPAAGTIEIGGTGLRAFSLDELRDAIAVVPQDPLLFDTSVLENLTFARPDASRAEVDRALELACLRDVAARLPEGLQTRVGQRGFRLSGGERQRICLARAILARPHVLVLDEALTGVDVEMEARILETLRRELTATTLIAITHRLSSIAAFDPIVVVENGSVVAEGSHEQACRASGWYRSACGEPAIA